MGKFIKQMRRIDRIIPNKVIHDPSNSFLLRGRNLVCTPAPTLGIDHMGPQNSFEVGCMAYAMRKENEALKNYLLNSKNNNALPAGLQAHMQDTMDANHKNYASLYTKLKANLKYDNSQPISTLIECLYVGTIMNDMTVDYYNKYLQAFINEKLEHASQQNLIDFVVSLNCIGVDSSDLVLMRAQQLLRDKLSTRYEQVTNTTGLNDQYEGVSEDTVDGRSNAVFAQYVHAFGPNGSLLSTGRYKFYFRYMWAPFRNVVFGRIFRRNFDFGHIYDKPSDKDEMERLDEVMRASGSGQEMLGDNTGAN